MEYYNGIDEIIESRRQHVNFSPSAYLTIQEDIRNFDTSGKITKTGFLNTIFQNYYELADASISIREKSQRDSLLDIFTKSIDKNKEFIDTYVKLYVSKLKKKIKSYQLGTSDTSEKLRLDKKTQLILCSNQKLGSDKYEGSVGKYLKAIYEEYALKLPYEREQIYFADTYNKITDSITNKKALRITLYSKKSYYVIPYKITQNKTNTYNYLVGYSFEDDDNKNSKKTASFRISNIAHIQTHGKFTLKSDEIKKLELELHTKSAEFMTGDLSRIKVRFSNLGISLFKKQLYLRPNEYEVDSNNDHIYNFSCTFTQANYYFFKFGNEVEILEPLDLRAHFKEKYRTAYEVYKDKED